MSKASLIQPVYWYSLVASLATSECVSELVCLLSTYSRQSFLAFNLSPRQALALILLDFTFRRGPTGTVTAGMKLSHLMSTWWIALLASTLLKAMTVVCQTPMLPGHCKTLKTECRNVDAQVISKSLILSRCTREWVTLRSRNTNSKYTSYCCGLAPPTCTVCSTH